MQNENSTNAIGATIAALRKQRNISQEALAEAIGVSGQAVSKWECGGSPDTQLLPIIADFFSVTIDQIFGRTRGDSNADIQKEITKNLITAVEEERGLQQAFDYIWMAHKTYLFAKLERRSDVFKGMLAEQENMTMDDVWKNGSGIHRQIIYNDEGMSLASLDPARRYTFTMPEPPDGLRMEYDEKFTRLFTLLADPNALKVLLLLYSREGRMSFTPHLLEKELGITQKESEELLDKIGEVFKSIWKQEIDGDDEIPATYQFGRDVPNFIPLMIFASEIFPKKITKTMTTDRSKPWFAKIKTEEDKQ